jgi:Domain of unknown function (DUF5615)
VRLLLDEHYAKAIAEQLRSLGHDVTAVTERPDLVGLEDRELFAAMAVEQRAVVTVNWADFQRELRAAELSGTPHYGVLFTSAKHLPRSANTIGLFVRVLDDFLTRRPADDALANSFRWLPDRVI